MEVPNRSGIRKCGNELTETHNLSVRSRSGISSGPTECQLWGKKSRDIKRPLRNVRYILKPIKKMADKKAYDIDLLEEENLSYIFSQLLL